MKCFWLSIEQCEAKEVDIEFNLDTYYKMLNCRCIDIATRRIGDQYFDFIVDDEGAIVDKPYVTCLNDEMEGMLYGSLIICRSENGEEKPLTDEDIELIKKHLFMGVIDYKDDREPKSQYCLVGVGY